MEIGFFTDYLLPIELELNFDFNASWNFQVHESVNSLLSWVHDVDESLMSSAFKLFTAILVLMNCTKDCNDLSLCWKWDWAGNLSVCALCGLNDLFSGLVDELMIISLKSDSNHFLCCCHFCVPPNERT